MILDIPWGIKAYVIAFIYSIIGYHLYKNWRKEQEKKGEKIQNIQT